MAEQRKKLGTVTVSRAGQEGTETLLTCEVFPATEWEDGDPGLYRLRLNRSWENEDVCRYRDLKGLMQLLTEYVQKLDQEGEAPKKPARRKVHYMDSCFAPYGPADKDLGIPLTNCHARILCSDTVIGRDGRQYVVVSAHELGGVRLMAIDDLNFYDSEKR